MTKKPKGGRGNPQLSEEETERLYARYESGDATLTALAKEVGISAPSLSVRFKKIRAHDHPETIESLREQVEDLTQRLLVLEQILKTHTLVPQQRWKD